MDWLNFSVFDLDPSEDKIRLDDIDIDREREDSPDREFDILEKSPLLVLNDIVPFSCNIYKASLCEHVCT